ncbi:MAG: hypothetical protein NC217_01140 [Muribaculaceae bacterium]|nr:hypothetical protein [Muribaculaceae bacterium]
MKKAWLEMGQALRLQETHVKDPYQFQKKKTALDRLRDKYRIFWTIAPLLAFGTFMIFSRGWLVQTPLNLWLAIAFAVYFMVVFCMEFWLWRGVGTIDPLTMDVAEVMQKSAFYRKRHVQFVFFLIPMAIALLTFTGYVFSYNTDFLNGMITGAICGLIIGIIQFRRFMAEYKKLCE